MISLFTLIAILGAFLATNTCAVDNGLGITPQMGWDNWNAFGCGVSEKLLLQTAELIVDYGLKDLGYHYVILDDCWSIGRNKSNDNSLVADPKKFPHGMAAVGDKLHGLGLGFGMYSDAGKYTCAGYAGSLGYETIDANTFAGWGVDYLKYDNCYNEGQAGTQLISYSRYATMSRALNATGRPILYSICNWGDDFPWNWAATIANSWRISGDIYDSWDVYDPRCPCDGYNGWNCQLPGSQCSVTNIMNKAAFVVYKAKPGEWNDLDMLEVGNGAMTDTEYVAHFSMWAAVKSPLIMGNDLRAMKPSDLTILSNPAMIAVNQDPLGRSAIRRWMHKTDPTDWHSRTSIQMWSGDLVSTTGGTTNDMLVLLINGDVASLNLTARLADVFADHGMAGTAAQVGMSWEVRDLWANRMSNVEATRIIGNISIVTRNASTGYNPPPAAGTGRYNATKTPYAQGLASRDELLLGKVVTTVLPGGAISAMVEPHGARVFRLRAVETPLTKRSATSIELQKRPVFTRYIDRFLVFLGIFKARKGISGLGKEQDDCRPLREGCSYSIYGPER